MCKMKEVNIVLIVSALSFGKVHSQISITQADMPSANDTIRYSNAALNSITFNPNQTGSNYNWNFSSLTSNSQDIYQYKNSFNTSYFFYFINKIGLKTADSIGISTIQLKNIYSFYTKNSTVFKNEGQGYSYNNIPLANSYVDDDEIYQFPLQYGDHDSSTYYFDYNLSAYTTYIDYAQNGSRVNDVDGWGSITTPFATYPNALRIKTTIYSHDTITIFGFPLITNRKTIEYKWLSKTEKIPVLEISGTLVGQTYSINSVKYRNNVPIVSSTNDLNKEVAMMNVFPNPCGDKLNIYTSITNLNYKIYNTLGEQMLDGTVNANVTINTQSLKTGVYFISVFTASNKQVKRFKFTKE